MHQAVGRLDVELQTVALWLFLNSLQLPIYEQMPRGSSLPASCPRLPDFRGTVIGLGTPPRKRGGVVPAEPADCPRKEEALFLPRFAVGFSAQGGSPWFFAELAGALAALAGRKGFAWMRAVRLIGGLRRHLDPAYEYTLVERGQHMRGQLGGYLHDTEVVLDIDSADTPPRDAALAGYGTHQCAGGDVMRLPHILSLIHI